MMKTIAGHVVSVPFVPAVVTILCVLLVAIAVWKVSVSLFRVFRAMKLHQQELERQLATQEASA